MPKTITTSGGAVLFAALLWMLSQAALAQGRTSQGVDEFTVTVLSADNRPVLQGASEVDLGGLSNASSEAQRHDKSFSITRHLRLRVTRSNGAAGVVTLSAFLVRGCHPCKLRLDGSELKASPTLILQRVQLNGTTDHRLEIEIPASMPAGAVDAEIGWQVEEK